MSIRELLLYLGVVGLLPLQVLAESAEDVVAEVNGDIIRRHELETRFQDQYAYRALLFGPAERHRLRRNLLEVLINERLVAQKTERVQKRNSDHEVVAAEVPKDMDVVVSDEELRVFEDEQRTLQHAAEERRIRVIHWLTADLSPAEIENLRAAAEAVRLEALRAPNKFGSLARRHSQGPTRSRGGDLGYVTRQQLPAELQGVFEIARGEITQLLQTDQGLLLARVQNIRSSLQPTSPDELRATLIERKRQSAFNASLVQLREQAQIIRYLR